MAKYFNVYPNVFRAEPTCSRRKLCCMRSDKTLFTNVFQFVSVDVPESEVETSAEDEPRQRGKRSILLLKALAFGKGLVIGKLAGLAVG
jgi:hypothetical protein